MASSILELTFIPVRRTPARFTVDMTWIPVDATVIPAPVPTTLFLFKAEANQVDPAADYNLLEISPCRWRTIVDEACVGVYSFHVEDQGGFPIYTGYYDLLNTTAIFRPVNLLSVLDIERIGLEIKDNRGLRAQ